MKINKIRIILCLAGAGCLLLLLLYWLAVDRTDPVVNILPKPGFASKTTAFELNASDADSGILSLTVIASQDAQEYPLIMETFTDSHNDLTRTFTLESIDLKDGPVTIIAQVVDDSFAGFGKGNSRATSISMILDTIEPQATIMNNSLAIRQGGCGCIRYSLSEEVTLTGVQVGSSFFPSHKQESGNYISLFAFPHDAPTDTPIALVAKDTAGNQLTQTLPITASFGSFKQDTIIITDGFLETITTKYDQANLNQDSPLGTFLTINQDIRRQNNAHITQAGLTSAQERLWDGHFLRLPKAARRASFGDHRFYYYQNKLVDEQYHLGIDLASTAQADVPAANSGVIVFVGNLGIYGNVIIIDHGLGLQSVYAHLSSTKVNEGDQVTRGDLIAQTGKTGFALGDHLHFGLFLTGVAINPLEWWDKKWLQNTISPCFSS